MMGHAATLLGLACATALPAAAAAQGRWQPPGPAPAPARAVKSTLKVLDPHFPDNGVKPAADNEAARGRAPGRGYQQGWIEAGAVLTLQQQFLAGQPAAVTVTSAAAAPLALTVAEPGEQPVCDGAARDCRWQPVYTGRFAITLRNAGGARVRYILIVE